MKFRSKILTIDAYRLTGSGRRWSAFYDWCEKVGFSGWDYGSGGTVIIPTAKDSIIARPGDWIVKDSEGAFCVIPANFFEKFFETTGTEQPQSEEHSLASFTLPIAPQ